MLRRRTRRENEKNLCQEDPKHMKEDTLTRSTLFSIQRRL